MDMSKKMSLTEQLDYASTADQSIWGDGDPETWQLLSELAAEGVFAGSWLHFAAGDGRYNNWLLEHADQVLATDLDLSALQKLTRVTPDELKQKLQTQRQDLTQRFPFADQTFDGIFNTGTLHLFNEVVLDQVLGEIARVLQPGGSFIFDFATDTRREKADGTLITYEEVEYTAASAAHMLDRLLKKHHFTAEFFPCTVPPEEVTDGTGTYLFSCQYWLVKADRVI
jgi:SAM-dependent methyltransferase